MGAGNPVVQFPSIPLSDLPGLIRQRGSPDAYDGRKGIDSLAQLCREKLDADPFSGCLFIFRSRSGKAIRILAYDGQGFWIATKRLSKGRFKWWPTGNEPAKTLRAHQAQLLLAAGNPETEAAPVWRRVSA
jgi:transposase